MIKKQNKKSVLDLLLREHLGKKYDGSAGARIATHMRRSEIETEILQLFARISLAAAKRSINADFNSRNEISEMLSARASKPNTTIIGANAH